MKVRHSRVLRGNADIVLEKGDLISEIPNLSYGLPVGICPKCGEELVIRTGKNGKFIGCKGFSKGCKNTYNIKGFKAIKKMTISLLRDRRAGHGGELIKSLHVCKD